MSRRVIVRVVVLVSLVSALLMVPGMRASAADQVTIGLSLPSETDPFFTGMGNGASAAAEDLGITLVIKAAADDPAVELANVEEMIAQGVDALVLSPVAGALSPDVVAAAREAGVPLIVTGTQVDVSQIDEVAVASIIQPYDEQGGWLAGSLLCEAIGGAGNVLAVTDNSASSLARSSGFNMFMTEMCADASVETLDASEMDIDAVIDAVAEALMSEAEITGVIAYNSTLTLALVDAAVVARAPATVRVMGFDATDEVMVALQDGHLTSVVTPVGWLLGSAGIQTALNVLDGMEVEANLWVNMGVLNLNSVMAFRDGSGEGPDGGDPREGSFEGGPGSGQFEGGPGSGQFEGGPGSGQFEGGPGSGQFEGGPGSGQFEGGPGSGQFEGGPGSGQFEGGPGSGQFESGSGGDD